MINTPSSGPRMRLTASATNLIESMSRPESVSSRIAISGLSIAICRISARFFSPPENPSLMYRGRNESSMCSTSSSSLSIERNSFGAQVSNLKISQLIVLLRHVCAVLRSLRHPRRARHVGPEQPLVHLLLADTWKPRPGGDILNGAVAVPDRKPALAKLDHLGHVAVLSGQASQLADLR